MIVTTLEDAREAEAGGADRLEIVRDLEVGGLTPSLDLVTEIVARVATPARVMLRETANFVVSGEAEMDRLCRTIAALARLPIDGVVLGFLSGGRVDLHTTGKILSAAPAVRATFHRAFEETESPFEDLAELEKFKQTDRILTSGGPGELAERAARLDAFQKVCGSGITILAGGGLTLEGARYLQAHTSIREFHVGAAVRVPNTLSGVVSASQVAWFRRESGLDTTSQLLMDR